MRVRRVREARSEHGRIASLCVRGRVHVHVHTHWTVVHTQRIHALEPTKNQPEMQKMSLLGSQEALTSHSQGTRAQDSTSMPRRPCFRLLSEKDQNVRQKL